MCIEQVGEAGDGIKGVEVVDAAVQPVHAILMAGCARQQRSSTVNDNNC